MTVLERVHSIINSEIDMEADGPASIEKMIYLAYYIGREEADRECSDKYNAHIAAQKKRASECRYKHMAAAIVGPEDYIYTPDYAQDMTALLGSDRADI